MTRLRLRWVGHTGIFGLRLASAAGTRPPWMDKLTTLPRQGPRE
jgi:hypothetical protein